jgi:dTDP-4-dehydrorhamnose reductase
MLKVLLVGGGGFLGPKLAAGFARAGIGFLATTRSTLDLEQPVEPQLRALVVSGGFTHAVLSAAMADLEACFRDPVRSRRVNVEAPAELFSLLAELGVRVSFISTDMVFDCTRDFRTEDEPTGPTTLYGRQKCETEKFLLGSARDALVFRTSKLMSMEPDPRNILTPLVRTAREGALYRAFRDQYVTPVFAEDVADAVAAAFLRGSTGVFHLAGDERLSRVELARRVCRFFGSDGSGIEEGSIHAAPVSEPRGPYHTLSAARAKRELDFRPTPLEDGLARLRACL